MPQISTNYQDPHFPRGNTYDEVCEADTIYGSVFDYAMEATKHIIDPDVRDSLDDDDFGVKKDRKYPLRVPGNKFLTEELTAKAIQMFHFCNPNWKEELAKNIVRIIKEEQLTVKISRKSQILKYVKVSDIPKDNLA